MATENPTLPMTVELRIDQESFAPCQNEVPVCVFGQTYELVMQSPARVGRVMIVLRDRDDPKTPIDEAFLGVTPLYIENHPYDYTYITYQGVEYGGLDILHPDPDTGTLIVAMTFKKNYYVRQAEVSKVGTIPITYFANWEILIFTPDQTSQPKSVPIMITTLMGSALPTVLFALKGQPAHVQAKLRDTIIKMDQTLHECYTVVGKRKNLSLKKKKFSS